MSSSVSQSHSSSPQTFISNLYCILSALFFATCAYAQLNDPDPALWVLAYLGLGVVPNLLLTSCPVESMRKPLRSLLLGSACVMMMIVTFKMITVVPKLELEAAEGGLGWHFLEHEEGRDSCGLLLLVAHVMYLIRTFLGDPSQAQARRRSSSNKMQSSSNNLLSSFLAVGSSPVVQTICLLSILVGAVYLWVVHHPDMVAKYKVPHCQGGMFGRDDSIAGEL